MKQIKQILPKLDQFQHKGRNGRLGVIGGCYEYTGAPFYSAISLLKGGADLAHIFCTQSAAIPIKSYSPEIIVHPYLFADEQLTYGSGQAILNKIGDPNYEQIVAEYKKQEIQNTIKNIQAWYQALHAFIIGPGIGRDEHICSYIPELIQNMHDQIVVLDADGLWFLSHGNPEKMFKIVSDPKKSGNIILTPNQVEFERLWEVYFPGEQPSLNRHQKQDLITKRDYIQEYEFNKNNTQNLNKSNKEQIQEIDIEDDLVKDTVKLARKFNNVNVIHKGSVDIITNGKKAYLVTQMGSLKRCGGIGDVLTGLTGLYAYWGSKKLDEDPQGVLKGCVMGSYITRKSSLKAYDKYKFGLTAPNITEQIASTFNDFYFEQQQQQDNEEINNQSKL